MKSTSTARSMARQRSLMKIMAPFRTPTSSGGSSGVVGGDLGAELGHPPGQGLRDRRSAARRRAATTRAGQGDVLGRPRPSPVPTAPIDDLPERTRPGSSHQPCGALRRRTRRPHRRLELGRHGNASATARTRSTSARVGGCRSSPVAPPPPEPGLSRSQRRTARRASRRTGAAAERPGVGGSGSRRTPARRAPRPRRRARHACRAKTGTGSRRASSAAQGQELVADPVAQVTAGPRSTGRRPAGARGPGRAAAVSARRSAEQRMAVARCACRPGRRAPRPAKQVDEDGLGLVVHGVAGGHLRPAGRRSGPHGPAPRGSGRRSTHDALGAEARPRAAGPPRRRLGLGGRALRAQAVVDVDAP